MYLELIAYSYIYNTLNLALSHAANEIRAMWLAFKHVLKCQIPSFTCNHPLSEANDQLMALHKYMESNKV